MTGELPESALLRPVSAARVRFRDLLEALVGGAPRTDVPRVTAPGTDAGGLDRRLAMEAELRMPPRVELERRLEAARCAWVNQPGVETWVHTGDDNVTCRVAPGTDEHFVIRAHAGQRFLDLWDDGLGGILIRCPLEHPRLVAPPAVPVTPGEAAELIERFGRRAGGECLGYPCSIGLHQPSCPHG